MSKQFQIKDVRIINFTSVEDYWPRVKTHPLEPLIEAVMVITMSHMEYQKLLKLDRQND